MRSRILLTFICLLSLNKVVAQMVTPFTLPDSIKDKTNTIVLSENTTFTILDARTTNIVYEADVIVLNKYAKSRTTVVLFYDQFIEIKDAVIEEIDRLGKVTDRFKIKDFGDYSAAGYSVASDARVKALELTVKNYPHRFKVKYEIQKNHTYSYPLWSAQDSEGEYVVEATLNVINKTDNSFRYELINIDEPNLTTTGTDKTYTWKVNNLQPIDYELYNNYRENYFSMVRLAPNEFEMDGHPGDFSSWLTFGQWFQKLNAGKNNLTPEQLQEIKSIVKDSDTDLLKTRKVYEYMQNRTRYVSIQLGIGGLQPFDAAYVHEKAYGDCKALSFYTKSLLEAVGVKSYYTIIEAGKYPDEINEKFPYDPFNHVILTVPLENDTIWLECTSQTNPFGYLGRFTADRKALMIDDDGGKLIHTKVYTENDNVQTTTAQVIIDKNGSANAVVKRSMQGIEIENDNFEYMLLKTKDEQGRWFYDELDWGTFTVNDYKLEKLSENVVPKGEFEVDISINNIAKHSANRLFLKPAHFTDVSYINVKTPRRVKDMYIRFPFTQIDTVSYIFPDAYHAEKGLDDIDVTNEFGSYTRKVEINEKGILYIRRFIIRKGHYPPEKYKEFREFIQDVQKYDRQRVVMVGST